MTVIETHGTDIDLGIVSPHSPGDGGASSSHHTVLPPGD
jgi:hypothetical protein